MKPFILHICYLPVEQSHVFASAALSETVEKKNQWKKEDQLVSGWVGRRDWQTFRTVQVCEPFCNRDKDNSES